jgi:MoxR-like ATPase
MSEDVRRRESIEQFQKDLAAVRAEVARVIVGQGEIVDGVLTCLLAGGHCLLEGVPGLGKTLLVRTLGRALDLSSRASSSPPTSSPSTSSARRCSSRTSRGAKAFEFQRGPIFANLVLADEINRATPKTQSALLEAMQEQSVTVARKTHASTSPSSCSPRRTPWRWRAPTPSPRPSSTASSSSSRSPSPSAKRLHAILDRTTGNAVAEVKPVLERERILALRALVRRGARRPLRAGPRHARRARDAPRPRRARRPR